VVAWLAILGVVVAAGLLGAREADRSDLALAPDATVRAPSPFASPRPSVGQPAPDQLGPRTLVVRGWVAKSAGAVQVMVTSAAGSPIAVGAVDPTGHPRNGMIPFETTFALPRSQSSPDHDLLVVPIDADGSPLEADTWRAVRGGIVELFVR
jgi:hypothetical protein